MADELRLGLIGAGRWGRNIIRTIAGLEGVRLAALASRNPESVRLVTADCAVSGDWHAMLDQGAIDAVIVATPPALHAEMVRAAVARDLPVLAEKPLTLDLREAQALRDFVAERAGTVMVDHTHLFHPAYRALKRALPGLGPIRAIESLAGNEGPFRSDVPVLWDWGAHDVAFCLDLLGALPREVGASIVARRETPEGVGQVVEIRASFPGAVSAVARFGNILAKARRLSVYVEGGVLVYDDVAQDKLMLHPPAQPHEAPREPGAPLPYEAGMPLSCAVSEFARAARAADTSLGSLDLGVDVVRVLERCEAALAGA